MHRGLAAREAVAGGFFESADFCGECGGGRMDGGEGRAGFCGIFDFGDEGGADDGGVSEAPKNGDMAGKRNAEADGDR